MVSILLNIEYLYDKITVAIAKSLCMLYLRRHRMIEIRSNLFYLL